MDSDPSDTGTVNPGQHDDDSREQRKTEDRNGNQMEDITVVIHDEAGQRLTASGTGVLGSGTQGTSTRSRIVAHGNADSTDSFESSFVVVPENIIEAQRISNNYMFGFKKWKSHVTTRPIATRSEIVQDLYSDIDTVKSSDISMIRPFNVIYIFMFGWWLALIYVLVAAVMFITVIGTNYGFFCLRMAKYFFWPFGKFVHQVHQVPLCDVANTHRRLSTKENGTPSESEALLQKKNNSSLLASDKHPASPVTARQKPSIWKLPQTYVWLLLGVPILWPVHAVACFLSWFFVISIPIAKVNFKMLTRILFTSPTNIQVGDQSEVTLNRGKQYSEIIMLTHRAVNPYYYKMTVDGVNVILVNLLLFVVLSIAVGYADQDNVVTNSTSKCILGVLAIVPLTYYVGMAITSISAQSSFAVGAILNATFGSMVEVILFVIMLKKGSDEGLECYQELVKSSLTGAILVSILFIPGISMVTGGIKFRRQNFNPMSANVSAALLFVSIAGMFSPTMFSQLYGHFDCEDCQPQSDLVSLDNGDVTNYTVKPGFFCKMCTQTVFGPNGERTMYDSKVRPLVYCCVIILPVAYIVGLVFTMKTHNSEVYDEFETKLKLENGVSSSNLLGSAQWSRTKSVLILLACATAITLCGDLISDNIQPLLEKSGLSEYFIGVTMLSLVTELPEVVNGIQFALQNNVNLGIEIGSSTAIQVALVQVPMLVLVDLIYPMGFHLIFAEVHLWAVLFSVIVINYIFQDGKSDYFQGSIVVFIYILLMMMYVFTVPPDNAVCLTEQFSPGNLTNITTHKQHGDLRHILLSV